MGPSWATAARSLRDTGSSAFKWRRDIGRYECEINRKNTLGAARGNGRRSRMADTGRIRRPFPQGDMLPGFPDAQKVRAKTPRPGGGRRSRWKTEDGRIIERDRLHDTVEVYDASGRRHLGEFDPWDGRQVGPPDSTRSVEP